MHDAETEKEPVDTFYRRTSCRGMRMNALRIIH